MALSVEHRTNIQRRLSPVIGDQETTALLDSLPHQPATRDFVHAEIAGVRAEMAEEFGKVRTEMADEFGKVRTEMAQGFERMSERMRQQTVWLAGFTLGAMSLLAAAGHLFH